MPNLTSVGLTAGAATSGTGTVSTIDNLIGTAGTGSAQVLTVQGNASGTAVPVSLTSTTVTGTVAVTESGTWTVQPGNTPNTSPWLAKLSDGTNAVAVKAASTAPSATDPALVVALSPNGTNANGQTTMSASAPVVIASDQSKIPIHGDTASGSSDANNPVKIGGVAKTANPTAVTDGQRVNGLFDKLGKQVVVHAIRDLVGDQNTTITASTSATTIVTAVASTFLDLVSLTLTNTSATGTEVQLFNDDGTTIRWVGFVPPTDMRGIVFDIPLTQTTVNNTWKLKTVTSITSLKITAQFVKNT